MTTCSRSPATPRVTSLSIDSTDGTASTLMTSRGPIEEAETASMVMSSTTSLRTPAQATGTSSRDRFGCFDFDGDGYSNANLEWAVSDGADAFPERPDPMEGPRPGRLRGQQRWVRAGHVPHHLRDLEDRPVRMH